MHPPVGAPPAAGKLRIFGANDNWKEVQNGGQTCILEHAPDGRSTASWRAPGHLLAPREAVHEDAANQQLERVVEHQG
jgi:hypothetical protein